MEAKIEESKQTTMAFLKAVIRCAEDRDVQDIAEIAYCTMCVAISMQAALYQKETALALYKQVADSLFKQEVKDDVGSDGDTIG